jgi:hypothetical protein
MTAKFPTGITMGITRGNPQLHMGVLTLVGSYPSFPSQPVHYVHGCYPKRLVTLISRHVFHCVGATSRSEGAWISKRAPAVASSPPLARSLRSLAAAARPPRADACHRNVVEAGSVVPTVVPLGGYVTRKSEMEMENEK